MITLEEAMLVGVYAHRAHQRAIGIIMGSLAMLYYKNGEIPLEPFTKMMLDDSKTSPTPDLILYDPVLAETPVIIEITHTDGVRSDLKKIRKLIADDDYGIVEGFVYDYKRNQWHKHHKIKGDILDAPSFCEAINMDLATLLRTYRPIAPSE